MSSNGSDGRSRAWAWATVTSPSRRAEKVIHADRVWPSGVMNVNDSSSA